MGLGPLERLTSDTTPQMLGGVGPGSFPYGGRFPPVTEKRPGNYADQAHRRAFPTADVLEQYEDGYATSSPVMSFAPHPLGLFDLGGNVREWVEDWLDARRSHRILRGGSWEDFTVDGIRSSKRLPSLPEIHRASHGFRCALDVSEKAVAEALPRSAGRGAAFASCLSSTQAPEAALADGGQATAPSISLAPSLSGRRLPLGVAR